MKKALVFFCVVGLLAGCSNDDEGNESISNLELLAGKVSKVWNVTSETPVDEECPVDSPRNLDNSWTFFNDGSFLYDHGTVTEDESECGDLVNLTGTWEFTSNETKLKVIALYETGNPANEFDDVLFEVDLVELTENQFKLSEIDQDTQIKYVITFNTK